MKKSDSGEFIVTSGTIASINIETFIDQRKANAFSKLTVSNTLQTLLPRSISNAKLTGVFALEENNLGTSDVNYELQVTYG